MTKRKYKRSFGQILLLPLELAPLTCSKDLQRAKFRISVTGHNFWLEWPTDLISTPLSYIFNALFRDTPLAYLSSRRMCHVTSHKWRSSHMSRVRAFNISVSLLENGDIVFTFSFSSWSVSIGNPFLFLLSRVEHILSEFSFPSRNWRKEFPVSHFPLVTGEKNFKFFFLFSIGPFALSSMTVSESHLRYIT